MPFWHGSIGASGGGLDRGLRVPFFVVVENGHPFVPEAMIAQIGI